MARYVVGTVDEIAPGTRKIVEVGGRSLGVFNVNGEYFALLNRCPHQAGPLCKGNAYGFLKSGAVGEYEYSRPGEIVRCPWHGWEFDVRTGQSWFDPVQVRVRRYDVTVAPGSALLGEGSDEQVAEGAAPPPAAPGTDPGRDRRHGRRRRRERAGHGGDGQGPVRGRDVPCDRSSRSTWSSRSAADAARRPIPPLLPLQREKRRSSSVGYLFSQNSVDIVIAWVHGGVYPIRSSASR